MKTWRCVICALVQSDVERHCVRCGTTPPKTSALFTANAAREIIRADAPQGDKEAP